MHKPLYKAPPRLQKMMKRLLEYDIDIKYKKGKDTSVTCCPGPSWAAQVMKSISTGPR